MMLRSVVLNVAGVEQVAQAADVRHVLADELIHQAAGAELVVRVAQVGRAHADQQAGGDLGARSSAGGSRARSTRR